MKVYTEEISTDSCAKTDFIDMTDTVLDIVKKSKIRNGIVNLFTRHTTTAIRINENEAGLIADTKRFLDKNAPQSTHYKHDDIENRLDVPVDEPCNAHSHLKSMVMGASETVPLIKSALTLGEFQRIFLIDLDGPRKRKMIVNIVGE